jgi:hypothetical protein
MILKNKNLLIACLCAYGMLFPVSALAVPTLSSPSVDEGEGAVEFQSGYEMDEDEEDVWEAELSASYGLTSFLEVEIAVEMGEGDNQDADFKALKAETKIEFFEEGTAWIDSGVKLEYEHALNSGEDEIGATLLLAKSYGAVTHKLNLGTGHEVGEDAESRWEYDASYGFAYDILDSFALGAEWYSDFDDTTKSFEEESHQVGPVAYGELPMGFEYEAGALIGVSDAAPDALVKLVLDYEF